MVFIFTFISLLLFIYTNSLRFKANFQVNMTACNRATNSRGSFLNNLNISQNGTIPRSSFVFRVPNRIYTVSQRWGQFWGNVIAYGTQWNQITQCQNRHLANITNESLSTSSIIYLFPILCERLCTYSAWKILVYILS